MVLQGVEEEKNENEEQIMEMSNRTNFTVSKETAITEMRRIGRKERALRDQY